MYNTPILSLDMLEVRNISCERNDKLLFESVSFTLQAGEIIHLVGRNGAGKTSLLRIICGLSTPLSGEVLWKTQRILKNRYAYQKALAYVAHSNGCKPNLTAFENLTLYCVLHNSDISQIDGALETVGLLKQKHRLCQTLSQGQSRRLSLARVLLSNAELWVLDEPFSALDQDGVNVFIQRIEQHKQHGGSVLITSHSRLPIAEVVEVAI